MEYGTVNISTKNVKRCVRKCFLIAKDGAVPRSLLEHCGCQQEEHWTKKRKKHKISKCRHGKKWWSGAACVGGVGGGYDTKTERKDASSLNMYAWEARSEERGKTKGKESFSLLGLEAASLGMTAPCWPHAEQLPSVLSTQVRSMSSLISPLWKRILSSSQEKTDNVVEARSERHSLWFRMFSCSGTDYFSPLMCFSNIH